LRGGQGGHRGGGQNDIDPERDQFGRESRKPVWLPLGISVFDQDIAPLDVSEVTQPLTEGLWAVGDGVDRQVTYSSKLGRLLGLGGERRGEEAASNSSDEGSTIHYSIT
jgi:hypothetical protein